MRYPNSISNKSIKNVLGWYKNPIADTIAKVCNKLIDKLQYPTEVPAPAIFRNNHKEIILIKKDASSLAIAMIHDKTKVNYGCYHYCQEHKCIVKVEHLN